MTTSQPELARRIATAAAARGLEALDAPVSGGDGGARGARLAIMVGGSASGFEKARPIFDVMGKAVTHIGGPGAGQHTKMTNQIAITSTMMAVAESLTYARAAGLDPERVLGVMTSGVAASTLMKNTGPRMIAEEFVPGFFVKYFVKDLSIALTAAGRLGIDLPGMTLARGLYQKLMDGGCGAEGTEALYRIYNNLL